MDLGRFGISGRLSQAKRVEIFKKRHSRQLEIFKRGFFALYPRDGYGRKMRTYAALYV